jgi:hypothetical protein
LALKQFYIKNVGSAKIQRVQQKIPGCCRSSKMKTNFKKSAILTPWIKKPDIKYQGWYYPFSNGAPNITIGKFYFIKCWIWSWVFPLELYTLYLYCNSSLL